MWEVLKPRKQKTKQVKPVEIKCWFGYNDSSESDSSSDDSNWTDINRKQKSQEKREKIKQRNKTREEETLMKAKGMIGIGPITEDIKSKVDTTIKDKEMVRISLVTVLLQDQLDFNYEEIAQLDIKETHEGKESIIYFAAGGQEMMREIWIRKAESKNDQIIVKNYVPPQLYRRYMAISKVCAERRNVEKDLKTQIRYGSKDIEVHIKIKGSGEGFKKTNLVEFMGDNSIPTFDHTVKWRKRAERGERRIP